MQHPTDNPNELPLEPLILTVRGLRVILDTDLARLYGVTTKALNQALKRNLNRFPSDFAFQLIPEEIEFIRETVVSVGTENGEIHEKMNRSQKVTSSEVGYSGMRSQIVTASDKAVKLKRNQRYLPWAFTEHGALMAANILKNEKAAEMSVYVVRAFIRLRQIVLEHEVMARRVSDMELSLRVHGEALVDLYDKLEPLLDPPVENKPDREMGFRKP